MCNSDAVSRINKDYSCVCCATEKTSHACRFEKRRVFIWIARDVGCVACPAYKRRSTMLISAEFTPVSHVLRRWQHWLCYALCIICVCKDDHVLEKTLRVFRQQVRCCFCSRDFRTRCSMSAKNSLLTAIHVPLALLEVHCENVSWSRVLRSVLLFLLRSSDAARMSNLLLPTQQVWPISSGLRFSLWWAISRCHCCPVVWARPG